jgi:putative nucleotidyltransferase with HDIG domain
MTEIAQRIVEGASIPSIPHVLQSILALTSDPASSGRALEEKIMAEPGLVTHLLRTVNSAAYGLVRRVSSIRQAIVLLGYTSVRSMASGLILINTFHQLPRVARKYLEDVWAHALTTVGIANVLAATQAREKKDAILLAAMVHNVGHLVLAQHFEKDYEDLTKTDPFPSVADERGRFEVDHAELGALLLDSWKFDKAIIDIVRSHHEPESYKGEQRLLGILLLSQTLAQKTDSLKDFLAADAEHVDESILGMLRGVGLTWEELQGRTPAILQSIEAARQNLA